MSNLDLDFDLVSKDIKSKILQAEILLLEASKLASNNNITINDEDINSLFSIINNFPAPKWINSDYDDSGWQSSSSDCW